MKAEAVCTAPAWFSPRPDLRVKRSVPIAKSVKSPVHKTFANTNLILSEGVSPGKQTTLKGSLHSQQEMGPTGNECNVIFGGK